MNRREIRQQAKAQAAATKQSRAARKHEIAALPAAERQEARRADTRSSRAAAKQRKAEIAAWPRAERKVAKRLARREKKYLTRTRRTIVWSVVGAGVAALAVFAAPYVSDIRNHNNRTRLIQLHNSNRITVRETIIILLPKVSEDMTIRYL